MRGAAAASLGGHSVGTVVSIDADASGRAGLDFSGTVTVWHYALLPLASCDGHGRFGASI